MAQNEWNESEQNEGPAGLRKAFKKQQEELKELRAQLTGTLERERKFNVNEALASRGLDPRVAKFYPSDQQTDAESVDKWVEENKELFGGRQIQDGQGELNPSTLTEAEIRGYQTQADIAAYDRAVAMDLEARLKSAESPEEVMALLKTYAPPTM